MTSFPVVNDDKSLMYLYPLHHRDRYSICIYTTDQFLSHFNSLPKDKNFDYSNLKACAEDKINVTI